MEIKEKQYNAHSFATIMAERAKSKPGYVPIVCLNAEGQSVTKYAPLLGIVILVDGNEMEIGKFLEYLYDDIKNKDKKIEDLTALCLATQEIANNALKVAKNMENYMPTDYIGI